MNDVLLSTPRAAIAAASRDAASAPSHILATGRGDAAVACDAADDAYAFAAATHDFAAATNDSEQTATRAGEKWEKDAAISYDFKKIARETGLKSRDFDSILRETGLRLREIDLLNRVFKSKSNEIDSIPRNIASISREIDSRPRDIISMSRDIIFISRDMAASFLPFSASRHDATTALHERMCYFTDSMKKTNVNSLKSKAYAKH